MTILPFTSPDITLQTAGGKGTNLARLTQAGFPVPRGFIVAADAYQAFVDFNHLGEVINTCLKRLATDGTGQLDVGSALIRTAFSAGKMPLDTATSIREAYRELSAASVAVRSSATLEDLPDLSFAGQQDTYLNITKIDEVIKAVIDCWSSLWTARAIGYRKANHISLDGASLAVVVQEMVQSDVSGVLFTANPLTGLLGESVIDATFGLGEALVSGQVEPDHFVVSSLDGVIKEKSLGAKRISTRSRTGGGVEVVTENPSTQQTLTDLQIQQLVALGRQVQEEYGTPQDIEWAFANGQLFLLQARAITSLFPVPEISFSPRIIWLAFGAVQGLMGPMTPLGLDTVRNFVPNGANLFGVRMKPEDGHVFEVAGERLWIKFSDMIRNPVGNRVVFALLGNIEPSAVQILHNLVADPDMEAGKGRLKLTTLRRLMHFGGPVVWRLIKCIVNPEKGKAEFDAKIESYLAAARIVDTGDRFGKLAQVTSFIRNQVGGTLPSIVPFFIPVFGASMGALSLLNRIAGENSNLVLEVTRGLPNNVTTQMDLELWRTATFLEADSPSAQVFHQADATRLARDYLTEALPPAAQASITHFMDKYGMRGVGEIDLGQPRWHEDPTPVMNTLQSYLQIDPDLSPDATFARGEQVAQAAIDQLAADARRQHLGRLKEKLVRAAARRIRMLMGLRESPKFLAVRMMGIARRAMLEAGKEFSAAGTIDHPDDLSWLLLSEWEALARDESCDWRALVAKRRFAFQSELRRRQVPRVLVSDGRAFYEGIGAETDTGETITGSPVSPGVVEGIVHVVLDPRGAQLAPGEILVCPGTDPAWTPLFMTAGGLITEVGGMMTHGSVVAREYGIPAVVGVHQATLRLKDGQRIRLDGLEGKIVVVSSADRNL